LIISLLAAADLDGGIGKDGGVPWHLNGDLKLFKLLSMGHHLLMGRKTYQSIGRALPGRQVIILTRGTDLNAQGSLLVSSPGEAFALAESRGENELFIIGGGEIFAQTIAAAQRIYLTRVNTRASCDVYFPHIDSHEWVVLETGYHPQDAHNDHSFIFSRVERR
jgi:dihydrofolate reductase